MTIVSDMNAALDAERDKVLHGKRIKPNRRWRMGPAAIAALVACDPANGDVVYREADPTEYRGIPIERVEEPVKRFTGGGYIESDERFNGWELRA